MSKFVKFLSPVATVLSALLPKPQVPELTPPTTMPSPDDEAVKAARRRQIAAVQARSGRASTILSQSDGLGG